MTLARWAWLPLGAAAVAATAVLAWVGGSPQHREIAPNALASGLVYRKFSEHPADGSSHGGRDRVATVVLEGLRPGVPAAITLELSSRAERPVRVLAYARRSLRATRTTIGPEWSRVTIEQTPDEDGTLAIQFDRGPLTEAPARPSYLRVGRVSVEQAGAPRHGWPRLGLYLLFGLLATACWTSVLSRRRAAGLTLVSLLGLTAASRALPLQTAVLLPWCALALAAVLTWWWGSRALAALPGFDGACGRWLAFGMLLRIGFALGYDGADSDFHVHNVWEFRAGGVLTSVAPGLRHRLPVPYPPLLYVVPALLPRAWDAWTLRVALGLLEAVQPLLLWALVRASRGSDRAAAVAASTLGLMPEGILVVGKGIAANALGGATTLAALWAIAAGAHPVVIVGLLALGLLSHFGTAATLILLVAALGVVEARAEGLRVLAARWGALFIAGLIATAAYYGAVWPLARNALVEVGGAASAAGNAFGFHAVRLGKTAQDLILKFGGWVFLLPFAYGRAMCPQARLLRVWLVVGLVLGVAAVFTPLLFRFEYFAMPAVAWGAALGSADLEQRAKGWIVVGLRALSCALQIALVAGLATGRFDIINAVMESPRWPLFR